VAGVRQERERAGPPSPNGLDEREAEGQERGAVQRRRVAGRVVVVGMISVVMVMMLSHGR
jgi:hypothetical protein